MVEEVDFRQPSHAAASSTPTFFWKKAMPEKISQRCTPAAETPKNSRQKSRAKFHKPWLDFLSLVRSVVNSYPLSHAAALTVLELSSPTAASDM